jgi:hypothetical protein
MTHGRLTGLVFTFAVLGCEPPPAESPDGLSVGANTATSSATTGAATSTTGGGSSDFDPCKRCGAPAAVGTLASQDLVEVSGLAASAVHPDVYYVHNDSGDGARLFAIDSTGKERARFDVDGAFAVDWEDAATGPCPEGRCVYLADIGDNLAERSSYTVYRATEPKTLDGAQSLKAEPLHFTYPDGSRDAETLLVHPTTGELFIVSKVVVGASSLYRFPMPLTPGATVVLEKLGEVPSPSGITRFTAGSIHPQGKGILLRAYTMLYYYPLVGSVAEALAAEPCEVPVAVEKQGEAVDWTASGDGYVTISEGASAPVNRVGCP